MLLFWLFTPTRDGVLNSRIVTPPILPHSTTVVFILSALIHASVVCGLEPKGYFVILSPQKIPFAPLKRRPEPITPEAGVVPRSVDSTVPVSS